MVFALINPELKRRVHILGDQAKLDLDLYLNEFYKYDPTSAHIMEHSDINVVFLRDFVAPADLNELRYYKEFLMPTGVEHVADIFFRQGKKIVASICLHRDTSMPSFSETDMKILTPAQRFMEYAFNTIYTPPRSSQLKRISARFSFTARETEVVEALINGADNKTIARDLDIGLPTVKTHLNHIFEKSGVETRTQLLSKVLNFLEQGV